MLLFDVNGVIDADIALVGIEAARNLAEEVAGERVGSCRNSAPGISFRTASDDGLICDAGIVAFGKGVLITVPFGPMRRDRGS